MKTLTTAENKRLEEIESKTESFRDFLEVVIKDGWHSESTDFEDFIKTALETFLTQDEMNEEE